MPGNGNMKKSTQIQTRRLIDYIEEGSTLYIFLNWKKYLRVFLCKRGRMVIKCRSYAGGLDKYGGRLTKGSFKIL